MHIPDLSKDNQQLGPLAGRLVTLGLVGGLVLLAVAGAVGVGAAGGESTAQEGLVTGWAAVLRAYLVAFCFVTTICLGGLFFVLIQHATKAGWSVVVRRIAEALAGNLRWLWIAFLPILWGMWASDSTRLYPWAMSDAAHDHALIQKAAYLNPLFWTIRSAFYFLVWGGLSHWFLKKSTQQDATGDAWLTLRMQARSYPGIILFGLTTTFAGIDWIMTLEPHWFSTMFGVYFFAGSACGMFATMILIAMLLQRTGRLEHAITTEHYQDLGKQLFAFGIVFWAYIAYSQYMLIWYANLPEETNFFMVRQLGDWRRVSALLVLGHFFAPFLAITSRHMKRRRGILALAAGWMLLMHLVDLYWLIMPQVPDAALKQAPTYMALQERFRDLSIGFQPLVHPAALAGLLCLLVAGTAAALRHRNLVPARDPRLRESLAFENI